MPLRIYGLQTSESRHGLGITSKDKLYPKRGSSGSLQSGPIYWVRMESTNGTSDTVRTMVEPLEYRGRVNEDDTVFAQVNNGLPVRPYPFLFVGKIGSDVAKALTARIKWKAYWNNQEILIAEEGRDFMAPSPNGNWSQEALINSTPVNTHQPDRTINTIGASPDNSTERPPIVAAYRRYVFVYPDFPVTSSDRAWSGAPMKNSERHNTRPTVMPKLATNQVAGVSYSIDHGAETGGVIELYETGRLFFFQNCAEYKCQTGVLELEASIYESDTPGAQLIEQHRLWLHITASTQPPAERPKVYVPVIRVPMHGSRISSNPITRIDSIVVPQYSNHDQWMDDITLTHWLFPNNWESLLVSRGWSYLTSIGEQLTNEQASSRLNNFDWSNHEIPWLPLTNSARQGQIGLCFLNCTPIHFDPNDTQVTYSTSGLFNGQTGINSVATGYQGDRYVYSSPFMVFATEDDTGAQTATASTRIMFRSTPYLITIDFTDL